MVSSDLRGHLGIRALDLIRRQIYQGRVIDVGVDSVTLPNGVRAELDIVRHPGGSAIVAIDDSARVCLVRQFRHAMGGWLWELPAGRREDDEPPLHTARRELAEETGWAAAAWSSLDTMASCPAILTEIVYLFLARDLRRTDSALEPDEVLEVHWIPLAEALEWAASGKIHDAKTVVGLFRASLIVQPTGVP